MSEHTKPQAVPDLFLRPLPVGWPFVARQDAERPELWSVFELTPGHSDSVYILHTDLPQQTAQVLARELNRIYRRGLLDAQKKEKS